MDYGMWNERTNMSMLTDFYELTMANGYLDNGCGDTIVYFDAFFRNVPENGGYAVMAGVEQVIDYLSNLKFSEDDLEFLKNNYHFNDKFIEYLRNFEFTCDVWAIPEGTVIFPREPLVKVRGPVMQAQLLETALDGVALFQLYLNCHAFFSPPFLSRPLGARKNGGYFIII